MRLASLEAASEFTPRGHVHPLPRVHGRLPSSFCFASAAANCLTASRAIATPPTHSWLAPHPPIRQRQATTGCLPQRSRLTIKLAMQPRKRHAEVRVPTREAANDVAAVQCDQCVSRPERSTAYRPSGSPPQLVGSQAMNQGKAVVMVSRPMQVCAAHNAIERGLGVCASFAMINT